MLAYNDIGAHSLRGWSRFPPLSDSKTLKHYFHHRPASLRAQLSTVESARCRMRILAEVLTTSRPNFAEGHLKGQPALSCWWS